MATTTSLPKEGAPKGPQLQEVHVVSRARFVIVFLSMMLCVFLFALDQLIVATAIPRITSQFHSLSQLSWIANGFFLTLLAFSLSYAQWLTIFPAKHVLLFAIFMFELGSLLCGVAPNMPVLILGRAIAGLGGTGIFGSVIIILTELLTFQERAKYFGLMGVCFALASVLGPLVGGALTDHVSWRWCFYINLPIGGLAAAVIVLFVDTLPPYGRKDTYKGYGLHMFDQLAKCDWLGIVIVLGWGTCLILGLEWGGVTKRWDDGNVIACLVMIGVLPVVFVAWEKFMGDRAMFPLHLLSRRAVYGSAIVSWFMFATFMFAVYYLAEMYQAVYGYSATKAGVILLPLIFTNIITLIATGRIIAVTGRPYFIILLGPVLIAIGCGLLYTLDWTDGKSKPMGYSAILGVGVGCVLQNAIIVTQYEFSKEPKYIQLGTGIVTFFGFAGRTFGISLAGSVFGNMIQVNLTKYAPDLPDSLRIVVQKNADAVYAAVPEALRPQVLNAYVKTLDAVYLIGVPCAILAFFGAALIRNIQMDFAQKKPDGAAAPAGESTTDADKREKTPSELEGGSVEGAELEKRSLKEDV